MSSSHALLTLRMEHRWRPAGQLHHGGQYLSQCTQLLLVDLAGSEEGGEVQMFFAQPF